MKMLKPDTVFEEKIKEWYGGEPNPDFMQALNNTASAYEKWGRADASKEKDAAEDRYFQFGGKLCFPDDHDMAEAMADYMKLCYMDGYRKGDAA